MKTSLMPASSEYKLSDYEKLLQRLIEKLGDPIFPSWEEVLKRWKQRTNPLPPMSCMYIYDYKKRGTVLSKGFSLLGYPDEDTFDNGQMANLMHVNQKRIIFLQAIYNAFESQKMAQFTKDGNLILTTLRAYKDRSGGCWLGQQTIEPFQNDEFGNLVRYLGWVHILGKYNGEPLSTRFHLNNSLDENTIKKFNREVLKVRTLVFEQLGFTQQQCRVIQLMNIPGSNIKDICETMKITKATLQYHRLGILERGRQIFPLNNFKTARDVVKYLADQQVI